MSLGLLPLAIAFVSCYGVWRELAVRNITTSDRRLSFTLCALSCGAILTAIVELLSLLHALDRAGLLICWWIVAITLTWIAVALAYRRGSKMRALRFQDLLDLRDRFAAQPLSAKMSIAAMSAIVFAVGVVALFTPNTNWDSMIYHMPRVMHWAQQRSVEIFPFNDQREVLFAPWAEFGIATLYLLGGSDRLANMVQWSALLGSIVAVSWMAEELLRAGIGAAPGHTEGESCQRSAVASAMACLFVASIPIGIAEAVTTQNDFVAAYWIVCAAVCLLALRSNPRRYVFLCAAGVALGLAILTKATAYLYAGPSLVFLGVLLLLRRRGRARAVIAAAAVMAALALSLNAPNLLRTYREFHSPVTTPSMRKLLVNDEFSVSGTAANLIRNAALHSETGIPVVTTAINDFLSIAYSVTRRPLDDPAITLTNTPIRFRFRDKRPINDSQAGCFYHLLLICLVGSAVCLAPRRHGWLAVAYVCCVAVAAVALCAYLRWQPWNTRLHIAYFALLAPVAGLGLARAPEAVRQALVALFAVVAYVALFRNETRPIGSESDFLFTPRAEQYFVESPGLYGPTEQIAQAVVKSNCRDVGLLLGSESWEYTLWHALHEHGYSGRLRHVFGNWNAPWRVGKSEPCLLIDSTGSPPPVVGSELPKRTAFGPYTIFQPE